MPKPTIPSRAVARTISDIAHRAALLARDMGADVSPLEIENDIALAHMRGTPLHLGALLEANNVDFCHDVFGIRENIDRASGAMRDFFVPRYASQLERK